MDELEIQIFYKTYEYKMAILFLLNSDEKLTEVTKY